MDLGCPSYRDAAARLRDDLGASLSDVFVREVTEYVGEIVLWDDKQYSRLLPVGTKKHRLSNRCSS
jgi:hypothetical protein